MTERDVLLVGAGPMARAYAAVLGALGRGVMVVGRGEASASTFEEATGISVARGGVEDFLSGSRAVPEVAIVSVGVDTLAPTSIRLIEAGIKRVLVEKPGALDGRGIRAIQEAARISGAEVFVAYNRRFYASALHAKRLIVEDGGVLSCNFEFTEWGHEIEKLPFSRAVKENWLLANSTHVLDLAFHIAGEPVEMQCYHAGTLPWHPPAAVFAGAGVTSRGALFSYQANWGAPGRWALEAITANLRLIFRPMEQLHVMRKGSVTIDAVAIDDSLDKEFKPGVYEQARRFLAGDQEDLCSVAEQARRWDHYARMGGYLA